ncbi:MAG: hypothetical protein UT86_C0001G0174 [Candidatus Magasanikbacteria bacterium GW2011_GWC2_40_17]|uniref:Uncharacterized protein n=1 Tax=Candidatus Magasanikbacteria bacterium GW2011_GWA2_42_32 TaxID=1619039 RepID=A0A0G1A978_9BACT|nr:MAG: hypothetical protein UT86_C0001G0174 [Candidatus Magasanikbacteria bacterium GW2011_GWC2_40_17]KKS57534.1 MAG: hypothetical protein UV20_C0001G0174 [Candidatus Magasanikbacteria bacterium GW2011_GWA2_42_32]OGH85249.1 MAG: hypothetical protein A2294_00695 [Candidatus Magasanikbacteria bacterium RIFOXYB2_FULL_38_10]
MEGIQKIIKQKLSAENKQIHSPLQYWADIISQSFGERKKFGMYLGIIKRIGLEEAKKIFAEIKQSNVQNPGKLFLWKSKQKKD